MHNYATETAAKVILTKDEIDLIIALIDNNGEFIVKYSSEVAHKDIITYIGAKMMLANCDIDGKPITVINSVTPEIV